MKRVLSRFAAACIALVLTLGFTSCKSGSSPSVEDGVGIATDAYIYGYSLVTMDMTRKRFTNVAVPGDATGPMGQMIKLRTYPAVDNHAVTAPNADTLYTTAWIDVSKEPWLLSVPDMGNRYFLLPFLDGWTDVFEVPGTRTTGGKAATYAITGPGWSGTLPDGVKELKSPTGMVWLLGRIYCTGTPEDYKAVHALQDKFVLTPLSSYGKPYTPAPSTPDDSLDMKTAVRDLVDHMDIHDYFNYLALLMKTNPPSAADAPLVARMAKIGLVPGQDFDSSKLDAFDKEAIKAVPKAGQLRIVKKLEETPKINGWLFTTEAGTYGTDYLQRAMITAIGLGANRPQDAIYPTGDKAGDGSEFDASSKKYVIHFDKGQMPPAKGFWSITMYDKDYFFVPNPLNRYTLSSRNKFITNPVNIPSLKPNGAGHVEAIARFQYPFATPTSTKADRWAVTINFKSGPTYDDSNDQRVSIRAQFDTDGFAKLHGVVIDASKPPVPSPTYDELNREPTVFTLSVKSSQMTIPLPGLGGQIKVASVTGRLQMDKYWDATSQSYAAYDSGWLPLDMTDGNDTAHPNLVHSDLGFVDNIGIAIASVSTNFVEVGMRLLSFALIVSS